jgi:hypothetical protein
MIKFVECSRRSGKIGRDGVWHSRKDVWTGGRWNLLSPDLQSIARNTGEHLLDLLVDPVLEALQGILVAAGPAAEKDGASLFPEQEPFLAYRTGDARAVAAKKSGQASVDHRASPDEGW